MNRKRITASVLFLALILSAVTGCGQTQKESDTERTIPPDTETETTETGVETLSDNLPDTLDFGGAAFTILARGDENSYQEIDAENNGDVVNDAIFNRNLYIEDRFNVSLQPICGEGWRSYEKDLSRIQASVRAADNAYQLIAGYGVVIAPLALKNCFLDLNTLSYIDQNQPWWYRSTVDSMNICGSLYFITGDVGAITSLGGSYVLFENDRIAASNGIGDISEMVLDGTWTVDKMLSFTTLVYSDLNGDGVMDDNDQYGFALDAMIYADYFAIGSGIFQITYDKDHTPVYTPEIERMSSLVDKIAPIFNGNGALVGSHMLGNGGGGGRHYTMFPEGKLLFSSMELYLSYDASLRNMEDDFTILPYPKLDESQKEYHVNASHGASIWCIPADVRDPGMSAAILEAMGCYGYNHVTPAFFRICLQRKISRNEETTEMLEIIRDSAWVSAEYLYQQLFGNTCHSARDILSTGGNTASFYASKEKAVAASLEKTIAAFRALKTDGE